MFKQLVFLLSIGLFLATPAAAQTYSLERAVVNAAGGTVTNGPLMLNFSLGQVATGTQTGGNLRTTAGYWWDVLSTPVSVEEPEALPFEYALGPNVPNPFTTQTVVRYAIPAQADGRVAIEVYDVRGALVKTLVNGPAEPGMYTIIWNGQGDSGSTCSAGVYFIRFTAPGFVQHRRVVMLR